MSNCTDHSNKIVLRQGDTASVMIMPSRAIGEGMTLKAGLYTPYGKPLYETAYPDGDIVKIDDLNYTLELTHDLTRRLQGATSLRFSIHSKDLSFVNAGENGMTLVWEKEPVNANLKKQ